MATAYSEIRLSCFDNGGGRNAKSHTHDPSFEDAKSIGYRGVQRLVSGGKSVGKVAKDAVRSPTVVTVARALVNTSKAIYSISTGLILVTIATAAGVAILLGDKESAKILSETEEAIREFENCVDAQSKLFALQKAEALLNQLKQRIQRNPNNAALIEEVAKISEFIDVEKIHIYLEQDHLFNEPRSFRDNPPEIKEPIDRREPNWGVDDREFYA